MKAIEILKHYVHSIVPIEYSPTFVSEAIKELEELKERILHLESIETDMIMKENRSCIGCVNSIKSNSQYCISCSIQYQDNFKIIKNKQ